MSDEALRPGIRGNVGILLIILTSALRAHAAQLNATFVPLSGNWNVAANWDINQVPTNNVANTFNALLGGSAVTLNLAATIDNLTIGATGSLVINSAQSLTLVSAAGAGVITNGGIISLNAAGSVASLIATGGQITLTGGGTLIMGNNANNRISGANGGSLLNVNNTIQGSGNIGLNVMDITNQSVIIANQTTNLTIDPLSTLTNTGTLRANGSTLILASGIYSNTGGTIEALSGSFLDLSSATIAGGTLQTAGTGEIRTTFTETLDGSTNAITNLGSINVRGGDNLTILGTLSNQGMISLNSVGATTNLIASGGLVTLTGGGTVTIGNNSFNRIIAANGGTLLNVGNTIQGSGSIGANLMDITNQSLIIANQSVSLNIDPSTTLTNTGTLRANGGTLILASGTYSNTGGIIEALDGSFVDLSDATVAGGTLQTSGTGEIRTTNAETLDGSANAITNLGAINIRNNDNLTILGTLSNQGTISLNSAGSPSSMIASGGLVTLTGGGTLTMGNSSLNRISGTSGSSLLNVNNTIQGSGDVGVNAIGIVNQGSIVANNPTGLTINPADTASFINQGNLVASGSGGLALATGPFSTSGSVSVGVGSFITRTGAYTQTAGSTTVNGSLTASGGVDIQGGSLSGSGSIPSPVANAGIVAPGASAGILSMGSTYAQTSNGELTIEIGGLVAGTDYDRLVVTGNANLDGTLRVTLINGFVPNVNESFTVMTYGSHSGTFSNIIVPCAPGGNLMQVSVNATSVVVSVVAGVQGDITCDCLLTSEDISAFALALLNPTGFAAMYPNCNILAADFSNDTLVNGLDVAGFVDVLVQ